MSSTAAAGLPETGTWSIDPIHSIVTFSVTHHAVATFRASFAEVAGAYDAATGRLHGSVEFAHLLFAGMQPLEMLRGHLASDAFFDAEAHPTLSFESSDLRLDGGALSLNGTLTMRGVTKPLTATGTVRGPETVTNPMGVSDRIGIDLEATIDRREWGVSFNNEIAEGIINLGWDVTINATLELAQPKG